MERLTIRASPIQSQTDLMKLAMVEADKNVVWALKRGDVSVNNSLWTRLTAVGRSLSRADAATQFYALPPIVPVVRPCHLRQGTTSIRITSGPQSPVSPALGAVSSVAFLKGRLAMNHILEATLPINTSDLQPGNRAFGGAPMYSPAGSPSKSSWAKT